MSLVLYSHSGSYNHGCEAIVRGTKELLEHEALMVMSRNKCQDQEFGLESICKLLDEGGKLRPYSLRHFYLKFISIFDGQAYSKFLYQRILEQQEDIFLSIGGDVYCYGNAYQWMAFLNRELNKRGKKTILWGCSLNTELLQSLEILEDLNRYAAIVARESLTFEALKAQGIKNCYLLPDPAFYMPPEPVPYNFSNKEYVGMNVSPLVADKNPMVLKNYRSLIQYILENSKLQILLLPHVQSQHDDDRKVLSELKNMFPDERVMFMSHNYNAQQLKYIIGKCKYVVTARTHVSIASYSQNIPTLVLGYSVKSKGIARDIYGSEEHHVIGVEELKKETALTEEYIWMTEHPCIEQMKEYGAFVTRSRDAFEAVISDVRSSFGRQERCAVSGKEL